MSMDNRGFVRATDQAKGSVGKLQGALGGMKGMLAAGMFTAAAYAIGRVAGAAMKAADDIMNWSARMGVSAKVVQELKIEADEAGIAFKGLLSGFGLLAQKSQEALAGNKKYADSFRAMGLEMEELQQMSQEEMFYSLADAVQESGSRVETLSHLYTILGGQAEKLLPVLDALGKRNEEVLSESHVKMMDRINDKWEKFKRGSGRFFSNLTGSVATFSEEIFAGGQGNIFKNITNLGSAVLGSNFEDERDPETGERKYKLKSMQAAHDRHKVDEEAKKKEIEGQAELKRIEEEKARLEKEAEQRRKDEAKAAQLMERLDEGAFSRRLKRLSVEEQIKLVKEKIADAEERANKLQTSGDKIGMAGELLGIQKWQNQIDSLKAKNKLAPVSVSRTPMQSVGALIRRAPMRTDQLLQTQVGIQNSMDQHLMVLANELTDQGIRLRNVKNFYD